MAPQINWHLVRKRFDACVISKNEEEAVDRMLEDAEVYGYGNLMAWLAGAWAVMLVEEGLDPKTASLHVTGRSGYPITLFCGHADLENKKTPSYELGANDKQTQIKQPN